MTLLEAGVIVTWIGKLPEIQQYVIAACGFLGAVLGPVWGVVRAFRKHRRDAMDEQMRAFERAQEEVPKGLPPPSPSAVPPTRDADITGSFEAAAALGAKLARMEWTLETARERVRQLEAANREIGDDSALKSQALIDVRYKLELAEKRAEALAKERDALIERLAAVERAKTDPPPRSTER